MDIINQYIQKHLEKIEMQNQIVKNTNYIDWLYEFTKIYPTFTNSSWLYCREEISKEDYDKVIYLSAFFEGIASYHKKNLISELKDKLSTFYIIKYRDMYISIGLVGQGTCCFVQRLTEQTEQFTLYDNIMNDVEDSKFSVKKEKLAQIEKLIKELKEISTDYDAIQKVVKNSFL